MRAYGRRIHKVPPLPVLIDAIYHNRVSTVAISSINFSIANIKLKVRIFFLYFPVFFSVAFYPRGGGGKGQGDAPT